MRVLVTGGAGFIGSHIVHALHAKGVEVAVLDNLATGKRSNVPAGVKLFEIDLRDREKVLRTFQDYRPTHLSHQAAQASVKVSVDDPVTDAQVNLVGGLHALEGARAVGVSRVVFASTGGAIYGEVGDGQRANETWPARPKSPYAASKASFEYYLEVYSQNFGLGYTTLRYANVYGPRQDPHGEAGVVAIFVARLMKKEPVTLFARRDAGDDGCIRDYVYVKDVAAANLLALEGKIAGVYNVGTGTMTTTRMVAEAIGTSLGTTPQIQHGPPRQGDLEQSVLDPSKLQGSGWKSQYTFSEGISQTVESFRTAP